MKRYAWTIALIAAVAAMVAGLAQEHDTLVLAWARILCAACIGLSD